jgi:hypothetical protein
MVNKNIKYIFNYLQKVKVLRRTFTFWKISTLFNWYFGTTLRAVKIEHHQKYKQVLYNIANLQTVDEKTLSANLKTVSQSIINSTKCPKNPQYSLILDNNII